MATTRWRACQVSVSVTTRNRANDVIISSVGQQPAHGQPGVTRPYDDGVNAHHEARSPMKIICR